MSCLPTRGHVCTSRCLAQCPYMLPSVIDLWRFGAPLVVESRALRGDDVRRPKAHRRIVREVRNLGRRAYAPPRDVSPFPGRADESNPLAQDEMIDVHSEHYIAMMGVAVTAEASDEEDIYPQPTTIVVHDRMGTASQLDDDEALYRNNTPPGEDQTIDDLVMASTYGSQNLVFSGYEGIYWDEKRKGYYVFWTKRGLALQTRWFAIRVYQQGNVSVESAKDKARSAAIIFRHKVIEKVGGDMANKGGKLTPRHRRNRK